MNKRLQNKNEVSSGRAKPAAAPRGTLTTRTCSCGAPAGIAGVCESCGTERLAGKHSEISSAGSLTSRPVARDAGSSASDSAGGHNFSHMSVQADTSARAKNSSKSSPSKTVVEHHRERFSASIRRVPKSQSSLFGSRSGFGQRRKSSPAFGVPQHDATSGGEQREGLDFASLFAQTVMKPGEIRELQEGETIRLPDIAIPAIASHSQTDPIAGTLTYNPSVTQSGPAPPPFGATLPYTHALTGISVTLTRGTYNVSATVDNPITFQVNGGTATDIASETDSDITQGNYEQVVTDLTPDMSDLNGRPPRDNFWAEDLCIRHERFHADEDVVHGRAGVVAAQAWLNTQTASSVADVNRLLGAVPARVAATVDAAMAYPGREIRAYGDGAPLYLARANAIKAKGEAGEFPAAGGSTAPSKGLSRGEKVAIGLAAGAIGGAAIGAIGGPVGALIGAGIGLVVGLVAGLLA